MNHNKRRFSKSGHVANNIRYKEGLYYIFWKYMSERFRKRGLNLDNRTELMTTSKVINFTEKVSTRLMRRMYFDRKLEDTVMQYLWIATPMETPFNM